MVEPAKTSRLDLAVQVLPNGVRLFPDPAAQFSASLPLALELIGELQRGEQCGARRWNLGSTLNLADLTVDHTRERLDIGFVRITFYGVALPGDMNRDGTLQRGRPFRLEDRVVQSSAVYRTRVPCQLVGRRENVEEESDD
jgi:hypothetical protein